jgi:hypothetical protein
MKKQFIYVSLFVIACQFSSVFCQQIPVLDLSSAIEHPENISLSDFVESITYIPLATTYDCLIDKFPRVYVTKEFIVTITTYKCLVFNRKNGELVREIGRSGRGPGEYQSTIGFFNDILPAYYFSGWNGNLVKYTMDGVYRGEVKIPGFEDNFVSPSVPMNYSFINDSLIVCDFLIALGTEPKSLMIFNENGKVLKIFPNKDILKTKQHYVITTGESSFYRFNNNLFFQNMYNDTVFQITVDKIFPYFLLNRGKHSPPFESKWWSYGKQLQANFISLPQYCENKRFISFNFYLGRDKYFALYDKSLKILKVVDNKSGINNDIDGFIDLSFDYLNSRGELIGLIQANDLVSWLEKNPEKFKIMSPVLHKFQNIKMTDNPVVVIAKFKK